MVSTFLIVDSGAARKKLWGEAKMTSYYQWRAYLVYQKPGGKKYFPPPPTIALESDLN